MRALDGVWQDSYDTVTGSGESRDFRRFRCAFTDAPGTAIT